MVTSGAGTTGTTGTTGARAAGAPARRARGAWAGDRWWAPGAVVAAVTAVVSCLVTLAWRAWEAGGCGQGGAMFACLVESLVGAVVAVVLGPVLLWAAYRAAGVRRPVLSVLVAVVVALLLMPAPQLLGQVLRLLGTGRPLDDLLAPGVGVVLGLAALGGGLALQGPRRLRRAVLAGAALAAMVAASLLLAEEGAEFRAGPERPDRGGLGAAGSEGG